MNDAMVTGSLSAFEIHQELAFEQDGQLLKNSRPWLKLNVGFRDHWLSVLSDSQLKVFLCIALHMNLEAESWPSIKTIMRLTDKSRRTVLDAIHGKKGTQSKNGRGRDRRAIAGLVEMGIIEIEERKHHHGGRDSNLYRLKISDLSMGPDSKRADGRKDKGGSVADALGGSVADAPEVEPYIKQNQKTEVETTTQSKRRKAGAVRVVSETLSKIKSESGTSALELLERWRFKKSTFIKQVLDSYGREIAAEFLTQVELGIDSGEIKRPAAFMNKAISEGWLTDLDYSAARDIDTAAARRKYLRGWFDD